MLPIDTSGLVYDRINTDSYEANDLNRVGAMCETIVAAALAETDVIAALREQYGVAANEFTAPDYGVPSITAKTDFSTTDTYTLAEMKQYLQNVVNIVAAFPPEVYKKLPSDMRFLIAESANNIEEDLKQSAENLVKRANQTETNIINTAAAFQYSGEIYAGGII